jgi:RNA polymerase sigma-70 factor (sigma-E family)
MIRRMSKRSRFEEFAITHGDGLVKLAYAICRDRGRAEDAAQEALARVYQRWSRLEDDPLPYARRIAVNATRDDWRRGAREDRLHRQMAELATREPDDPQKRFVQNDALMQALDALPHGQRAVIVLRYLSQLSEAETAATLDISIGTVKSQTARALARMRETLTPPKPAAYELESA